MKTWLRRYKILTFRIRDDSTYRGRSRTPLEIHINREQNTYRIYYFSAYLLLCKCFRHDFPTLGLSTVEKTLFFLEIIS